MFICPCRFRQRKQNSDTMAYSLDFNNLQAPTAPTAPTRYWDQSRQAESNAFNYNQGLAFQQQNAEYNANLSKYQRASAAIGAADADAERSVSGEIAQANRETASRTGALARQLATARRSLGGGIRLGITRKGFSANSAGMGLNRANAGEKMARTKAANRAKIASRFAEEEEAQQRQAAQASQARASEIVSRGGFSIFY